MDLLGGTTDLIAVLPFVENLVNEKAVRPGDILTAYGGTKVEVVDPDAEGRLILADALAYVGEEFKPDVIVDIATLTKTAALVHPDVTAMFYAEDPKLAELVRVAGETTGERTWQMPPWPEHAYHVSSSVADVRNYGWESHAGGFMAAMFLRHFVPESCGPKRWIHIDLSKNTQNDASAVPFVGCGVALGIEIVKNLTA
jgi:leucyl aminopeptidase